MNQRKRKTIINNIESINMEIDYEKLADAIVKAQNNAKLDSKNKLKARRFLMSEFNMLFYFFLAAILLLAICLIWMGNLNSGLFSRIIVSALFLFLTVMSVKSAFESVEDKETDAHNHFNTNVSLVALIVALIALFKG